jgi:hypothetical protein
LVTAPILRGTPLGGESERAFFAFATLVCRKHTIAFMFENEVNKLFAFSFCNSRAGRKRFAYHHIASGLCLNSASSNPWTPNFYAAVAEFFPVVTDFCNLNIIEGRRRLAPRRGSLLRILSGADRKRRLQVER